MNHPYVLMSDAMTAVWIALAIAVPVAMSAGFFFGSEFEKRRKQRGESTNELSPLR